MLLLFFLLGTGCGALWLAPKASDAMPWLMAQDDPAALTDIGLKQDFNATRLRSELKAALDHHDIDLAGSFMELARQQGLAVPADLSLRYREAIAPAASAQRNLTDFYYGARNGAADSGAGFAGALVADFTGVGDIRDLIAQSRRMAAGKEPDRLVLGLAVAGLAITGATVVSFGAAMPARAGATALKTAAKAGRLSKPLAANLTRLVGQAVDTRAATAAAAAAARFEFTAARQTAKAALRPAAFRQLGNVATDLSTIGRRAGMRSVNEALTVARSGRELRSIATVAQVRGNATRAVLKVLGRGAIVLTSGALVLAGWVMGALSWLWLLLLLLLGVVKRTARAVLWSRRQVMRMAS
ncbi:MAG: hypothetical protein KDJ29_11100 [Hyphomicrobiales bacterium]|nr:hypothetical protein [Hyphomicrobiales bacterium]